MEDRSEYKYTVNEYAEKYGMKLNTVHGQIRRGLHETVRVGAQLFMKDKPPRYSYRGRKGVIQDAN